MKFSLSTGTLYIYPLRLVFRLAREAGFDGVEVVVNPEVVRRGGQAVRKLADEEGVGLLSVHPSVMPLPGWQERQGGRGATIRLAQETGAGLVVLHTPRSASLDEGEGLEFRQHVENWQARLAGTGLQLAVENKAVGTEADRRFALTPLDRLRAFADRHDIGLVLDTSHAGLANEDLLHARQVLDGRLANVHFSDMGARMPLATLPLARKMLDQHRFPGTGDLPLAALLAALWQSGYTGPVTLEVSPFDLRFWWLPSVRRRLTQAVEWMKGQLVTR